MIAFKRTALLLLIFTSSVAGAASGHLDPDFASEGVAVLDTTFQHTGYRGMDGYIDAQGRSLIAGEVSNAAGVSAILARFLPNGAPDPSFGTNGRLQLTGHASNPYFEFRAIAPAGDGAILAAGLSKVDFNGLNNARVRVCRVLSSGILDLGFGSSGCTLVTFVAASSTDQFNDMRVQADGRIVVFAHTVDGFAKYAVARLNADGSPDTCFGDPVNCLGSGAVVRPIDSIDFTDPGRLTVDAFGRIVITGRSGGVMVALRLESDGAVDTDFGTMGYRLITPGIVDTAVATAAHALPDGSLVVVGYKNIGGDRFAVVAKLNSIGNLDAGFGIAGFREFAYTDVSFNSVARGIAVQADGKLLVAGSTQSDQTPATAFTADCALARFTASGSFDGNFGFDGKNNFNSGSVDGEITGADVPDGCSNVASDGRRIVLFGQTGESHPSRMVLFGVDQDGLFADQFE